MQLWNIFECFQRCGTKNPAMKTSASVIEHKMNEYAVFIEVISNYTTFAFFQCNIVPDCTHYKELDFSMFAYEHLQAMLNRKNLELRPESALAQLLPVKTLEDFADVIDSGLKKNSSSWLHYNFGVLYWRIRGDAYKAIECARRALWCVPR